MVKLAMCSWSRSLSARRALLFHWSQRFLGSTSNSDKGDSTVRVRFAPSPTGEMHLGSLRTALYNYLFAKKRGGQFILRIEDTDQTRVVPGAARRIVDTLEWAGLTPDEGPSLGGDSGPYVQSERIQLYREYAHRLLEASSKACLTSFGCYAGHAYRCICTDARLDLLRKDALRNRQIPRYDNRCRSLDPDSPKLAGQPHVIRFKLFEGDLTFEDGVHGPVTLNTAEREGDPVILKSDGFPTYHLACVVDDHLMRVSHVLRGVEWQVSTPKHIMLHTALGWEPPRFFHLPLLLNKDGTKLSKRQGDVHVEKLKEAGFSPEALINFLVLAGGGFGKQEKDTFYDLEDMVAQFNPDELKGSSCRLDPERLVHLNRLHLCRSLDDPGKTLALAGELRRLLNQRQEPVPGDALSDDDLLHVLQETKGRLTSLNDLLSPSMEFVWRSPPDEGGQLSAENRDALRELYDCLESIGREKFDRNTLGVLLHDVSSDKGVKYSQMMQSLRKLLSGMQKGPGVAEMMALLGKERTLQRLQRHIDQ
ncbi:unnamed protein product [Ixodes hexagonus]